MLERARRVARACGLVARAFGLVARAFGLVLARTAFRVGQLEGPRVRRGLRRVVVAA